MATAAERARDKANRLARPAAAASEPSDRRVTRSKPFRMTLDFPPAFHAEFEDWAVSVSRRLGFKVQRTDVARALVRELLSDPDLEARIMAQLQADSRTD